MKRMSYFIERQDKMSDYTVRPIIHAQHQSSPRFRPAVQRRATHPSKPRVLWLGYVCMRESRPTLVLLGLVGR